MEKLLSLLPTRLLSTLMHHFMGCRWRWVKTPTIALMRRAYAIDLSEALDSQPQNYASFNAFFTRALKPGARPLAASSALISPVDGRISQCGAITGDTIYQAKGRNYSSGALLADPAAAAAYNDGQFMTIYLAPHNYHRIHMPCNGRLLRATFVPGRLLSVRPATAAAIDQLFARNERLVLHFASANGPFVLVMVGALFVGSLETVIEGRISPPHSRRMREFDYRAAPIELRRGDELGRFNMGSTVVLLFPPGTACFDPALTAESPLLMGQALSL